ncbi:MAG: hypothetical protein ABIP41_03980 [Croceibacterium sp.]
MKGLAILALAAVCAACGQNTAPAAKPDTAATPAAAPAKAAPKGRFAPRDECAKLPGSADFRQRLVEAVQLRDADALANLADPAVKLDFGGGGGLAALKQRLGQGSDLWLSLDQLTKLGCAVDQSGNLVMPWLFAQDLGRIDANSALLVIGEEVPVLSAPRASAAPIVTISWDFVSAANGIDRTQPYQRVTFPLNRDGWVATDKLRSVLDYRLLASRRSGQWRIEALVSGD